MAYIYNLAQKFRAVARQFPGAIALKSENGTMIYAELDRFSDGFAGYLQSLEIKPGDLICVSGDNKELAIIAILGAIKAGVVYSVFDAASPIARLSRIFEKCSPRAVFCKPDMSAALKNAGFCAVELDKAAAHYQRFQANCRSVEINAESPAYVMFTSGSSGFPKGAVMTHQNVLNLIAWSQEEFDFTSADVLSSVNPLYFDNSVFDIFASLFCGASLALFGEDTVRNPARLLHLIDQYRCSSWFSVPSTLIYLQNLHAFDENSMLSVKRIIFGGEGYPKRRLKELFGLFSKRTTFFNVYGPTECTCICSCSVVREIDLQEKQGFLPLGRLLPNFDFYILDEELAEVDSGQPGELVLRGPNVGLGYYRDAKETSARFIQNPFHDSYREIVYRTGDLVYLDKSSGLNIMGRIDNQVKHMGYRIELEEIESALNRLDHVKESTAIQCFINGFSQLIAFVSLQDKVTGNAAGNAADDAADDAAGNAAGNVADEKTIRAALKAQLPYYMIPTRFQFMEHLPKNANGKLDRQKLRTDYLEQTSNG